MEVIIDGSGGNKNIKSRVREYFVGGGISRNGRFISRSVEVDIEDWW